MEYTKEDFLDDLKLRNKFIKIVYGENLVRIKSKADRCQKNLLIAYSEKLEVCFMGISMRTYCKAQEEKRAGYDFMLILIDAYNDNMYYCSSSAAEKMLTQCSKTEERMDFRFNQADISDKLGGFMINTNDAVRLNDFLNSL